MAGASDALHAARDRRRCLDLDDKVDGAHVDAQLERRRRDERAHRAGLQAFLDLEPLGARDRAVVGERQRLARELVQRGGHALGEAAAVDEDERGAMRADQLEHARVRPSLMNLVSGGVGYTLLPGRVRGVMPQNVQLIPLQARYLMRQTIALNFLRTRERDPNLLALLSVCRLATGRTRLSLPHRAGSG